MNPSKVSISPPAGIWDWLLINYTNSKSELIVCYWNADDKEEVMKRKNALAKLTAPGKSLQTVQKNKGARKSAEGDPKEKAKK